MAGTTTPSGLIWGYMFDDSGTAQPLDGEHAMRALEEQHNWIWLHFDLVDGRCVENLRDLPHLPPEAREILIGTSDRPHIETIESPEGTVIAGVVMDFARADDLDPKHMSYWRFCMLPHAFISARRTPLHTMRAVQHRVQDGRRINGVLELFDAVVHAFISALAEVGRGLGERLDEIEEEMLDNNGAGDFAELGIVRRNTVRLLRQTQPLSSIISHLLQERPAWFTDQAAEDCAQVMRVVQTVAGDLTSLQERARALQDEIASRQTEETNKRLIVISVLSVLLLPPTLISGIFGMNVGGLPFTEDKTGFFYAMTLIVVSVGGLLIALRRWRLL